MVHSALESNAMECEIEWCIMWMVNSATCALQTLDKNEIQNATAS